MVFLANLVFHFYSGIYITTTVKQGNFDWRGSFDRSGSFVKVAMVPTQECLFIASAFMEINDWCSGFRIYVIKALFTL